MALLISIFRSSNDNVLRKMPQDLTDKSTLVQVMAWCCQATSHYLNQCWRRSPMPNGVTRPQWVNSSPSGQNGHHFACDIQRCIFMNENFCIWIKFSQKFALTGPINNVPALGLIMAWHHIGDKPLSKPLLTWFTNSYMRPWGKWVNESHGH